MNFDVVDDVVAVDILADDVDVIVADDVDVVVADVVVVVFVLLAFEKDNPVVIPEFTFLTLFREIFIRIYYSYF